MDQELKQRMIGASVIIALAVIFVPMMFGGDVEEKHNKNISINIPEESSNNLEVKKFALDKPVTESVELPANEVDLVVEQSQPVLIPRDEVPSDKPATTPIPITQNQVVNNQSDDSTTENPDSKPADKPTAKPEVASPVDSQASSTVATVEQPVDKIETKPVVSNTSNNKPAVSQTLSQGYRVKLGSFSQQANAEKVKSSLLQNNIKAIVEYNPGLKLYRVWSQEMYQSESSANAYVSAVNRLKLNIGTPKVITLTAPEVEVMASQGQLGWVVQLGSFSEKKNAIELRNKVSAAGYKGFVDRVVNSKGVELFRLRVGPLMEKTDAEKAQAEIKAKLKLAGLVKNHELGRIVN